MGEDVRRLRFIQQEALRSLSGAHHTAVKKKEESNGAKKSVCSFIKHALREEQNRFTLH
jgi:hypothetical protein